MDDRPGQRVNVERSRQALATGAPTVATACPFCTLMLEDGVRTAAREAGREAPEVKDLAELVAEALDEEALAAGWPPEEAGGRRA